MKKTLLLLLVVLCVAACKEEPDLPDDPHILFINNRLSEYGKRERDTGSSGQTEQAERRLRRRERFPILFLFWFTRDKMFKKRR